MRFGEKRFHLIIFLLIFTSCSLYHLQTPETVPVGKLSVGFGVVRSSRGRKWLPGFWVRTGVTPKFDIGVHTWGLGLKLDVKYSFNEYTAIGGGVAVQSPGYTIFKIEGSLYAGVPLETFYPYSVVRINLAGVGHSILIKGPPGFTFFPWVSGVAGSRLKLGERFFLYGDVGEVFAFPSTPKGRVYIPGLGGLIFELGSSFDY